MCFMKLNRLRIALPYFVFGSGACALIYESLWMRSFGLIFGNTTHAVSAILAIFMGGLAAGSYLATRIHFKNVIRAYALVEAGIGLTALVTIPLLYFLPEWYGTIIRAQGLGRSSELAFRIIGAALVLLPPTLLLGMTFPILIEFLTRLGKSFYANMGFLYRTNTLGGAFGVFFVTLILLPSLGKIATFIAAAAINLTIGWLAWKWGREYQELPVTEALSKAPASVGAAETEGTVSLAASADHVKERLPIVFILTAFATGLCSFGLEVLWTRSLALVIGSSIYSFNIMLVSLLLGIVAGTLAYESCWRRINRPLLWLSLILLALGAICLLDIALIGFLPVIFFALIKLLPVSFIGTSLVGFLLCFVTMFFVTSIFGFLFPLVTHFLKLQNLSAQKISGHLYVWNTAGTIVGSLGTGFLLVHYFGLQTSFVILASVPLLLGLWFLGQSLEWRQPAKCLAGILMLLACLALDKWYQPWDLHMMAAGIYKYGIEWRDKVPSAGMLPAQLHNVRKILFYKEGDDGVVCVAEAGKNRFISVNGKTDAGNDRDVITMKMTAHLPLILHSKAEKALVIGWGSGCTAGTASLYPLKQIDCIEIEPLMVRCGAYFTDINHAVTSDPRFHSYIRDGRNYLQVTSEMYDVIMSEPSNPWITGVSNLFTKDWYKIVKTRLRPDGVFCQWFHYYNLSPEDVKMQARTFAESFPCASMWQVPPLPAATGAAAVGSDILFIGSFQPHTLDYEKAKFWYSKKEIGSDLATLTGEEDELAFFCNYLMDKDDMLLFGKGMPLNTDNFPCLEYSAPKGLYKAFGDAVDSQWGIYTALQGAGREEFPPMKNYPPLLAEQTEKQHARNCLDIGKKYLHNGFAQRARSLFETAIEEDGENAEAYACLGDVLFSLHLPNEAEPLLKKAVAMNPRIKRPYEILGTLYYQRKELGKAQLMYHTLATDFPEDEAVYFQQAVIFKEQMNWMQAREMVKKTLAINPKHADAIQLQLFLNTQTN